MSHIEFHDQPLVHYWVVSDCIIMFFTMVYVYMVQSMKQKNELNKNIFSLHFKQKKKLDIIHQCHHEELEKIKNEAIKEEFENYYVNNSEVQSGA